MNELEPAPPAQFGIAEGGVLIAVPEGKAQELAVGGENCRTHVQTLGCLKLVFYQVFHGIGN